MEKNEKRSAVLYAYVKPSNKRYAEGFVKKTGYSISEFIDWLLAQHKKSDHASNTKKR